MRTVHKFPLRISDKQSIELPRGYQPLHIEEQKGDVFNTLYLWALIDKDEPLMDVLTLHCYATGEDIEDHFGINHWKTILLKNGQVYHFFRV